MWVIFLLSAMAFLICSLAIAYIANKVFIAMKKDLEKAEKEIKK